MFVVAICFAIITHVYGFEYLDATKCPCVKKSNTCVQNYCVSNCNDLICYDCPPDAFFNSDSAHLTQLGGPGNCGYPNDLENTITATCTWCCYVCCNGSHYYDGGYGNPSCIKCDSNAQIYNNKNMQGNTCVVAPSFAQKVNAFINSISKSVTTITVLSCGRKLRGNTCVDGHNNDDHRIGSAIDLQIFKNGVRLLPQQCNPKKLSHAEQYIVSRARQAGLVWGGDISTPDCNHFQITPVGPGTAALHRTPQYKKTINTFQKALKDRCTSECGVKPTAGQKCLC